MLEQDTEDQRLITSDMMKLALLPEYKKKICDIAIGTHHFHYKLDGDIPC
jgi:hypothetical protein